MSLLTFIFFIFVNLLAMAGQTAETNWPTFLEGNHGHRGDRLKIDFYLQNSKLFVK